MNMKKLSGKGLVIQLSSDKIRIAKTNLGAAMPQLQASFVADLPEGAVEDGVIHDLEKVREVLKNALATEELRRVKKVVFALCTTHSPGRNRCSRGRDDHGHDGGRGYGHGRGDGDAHHQPDGRDGCAWEYLLLGFFFIISMGGPSVKPFFFRK